MTTNATTIETPWSSVGWLTYRRCVHVKTPVLTANFDWTPAGSLKVGDKIIAFDENLTANKGRYIRIAEVQHNEIEEADCVCVELEDGTKLYCTPDHSWLVKIAQNDLQWREAKDLLETSAGGPIYLPRTFGNVWDEPTSYEDGYLAAAFDGEGSLDRTNSITFSQVQNGMMSRVRDYLDSRKITYSVKLKSSSSSIQYKNPRQECFDLRMYGFKQIARIVGGLNCTRMKDRLVSNLIKRPQRLRHSEEDMVRVINVYPAGKMKVAVLQTSTATHFTGGFPSHNTYARKREDGSLEDFPDTVERIIESSRNQLKVGFTPEEENRLRNYMLGLKGTVAGRFLWQMGTETVNRLGLLSLQNCAATVVDHPIRPFTWAFDALN